MGSSLTLTMASRAVVTTFGTPEAQASRRQGMYLLASVSGASSSCLASSCCWISAANRNTIQHRHRSQPTGRRRVNEQHLATLMSNRPFYRGSRSTSTTIDACRGFWWCTTAVDRFLSTCPSEFNTAAT